MAGWNEQYGYYHGGDCTCLFCADGRYEEKSERGSHIRSCETPPPQERGQPSFEQ
jgi:hypothetical protein